MKVKKIKEVRMISAVVGIAALILAGIGLGFLMPLAFGVVLFCTVPFLLCLGFYNLLRVKERIGFTKPSIRVLIIDDDIDSAVVTASAFTTAGWQTDVATTPARALDYLSYGSPSLVILDWVLSPALNGGDLLQNAILALSTREKSRAEPVPVVSLSSSPPQTINFDDSEYFKHMEYWQKPIQLNDMVSAAGRLAQSVAV
jgi:CheY-like chemotaxis protein